MAKIIFSSLVDSITGKLGGSVFQVTVGGFQIRNRVTPRNPRSVAQQRTRSVLAFLINNWNNLTGAERSSWIDNAPVGSTGISFYTAINQRISLTGAAFLNTYSPDTPFPNLLLSIEDLDPTLFVLSTPGYAPVLAAGIYLNVFVTPQLSPGTSFISPSSYRYLLSKDPGDQPFIPFTILSAYSAIYGTPVTNNVIGVKVYLINTNNGNLSADSIAQLPVL